MKKIEVNIPESPSEPRKRPLLKRVTPLGWLTAAVLGFFVISVILFLGRTLAGCSADLTDLPTFQPVTPTPHTATPTSLFPTATPTPDGWTVEQDPLTGEEYLSPPADDEAAIREAFEAVLDLHAITETADEAALHQQREDALEIALRVVSIPSWEGRDWDRWLTLVVPPENWGPSNPVRCDTYTTCTAAQAKIGQYSGAAAYYDPYCDQAGLQTPCLLQLPALAEDDSPYQLLHATLEYQEDGIWRITRFQVENLPELP